MPTVFRHDGYRFFFYSNEGDPREPIHVHVMKGDGEAKFWVSPVTVGGASDESMFSASSSLRGGRP